MTPVRARACRAIGGGIWQNLATEIIGTVVLVLAIITQGLNDSGKGLGTLGALITALVDPNNPYATAPGANAGACRPAVSNPVAAPTCSELGGSSYRFFWNDMGAGHDDFDFNDGVYNFSCNNTGQNTGVILTD